MPRVTQTTRHSDDIDITDEDEQKYDNYGRPRNFVGHYDETSPMTVQQRRARAAPRHASRLDLEGMYQDPVDAHLAAAGLPSTSAKAVASATTTTSTEAMGSTNELCLYLMDTCDPHCTKSCTSCKPRWSNLPSPEAEKAHIAQMENEHGIVKRINPKDDDKTIRVDVQNKHMKGILTNVFDGYPGFHASLLPEDSAWIFEEPFDMFFSRWDQLCEYGLRTSSAPEKAAWIALVEAMTPVVQPTLDSIQRIKDTDLVRWKDLSLIFHPGKLIVIEEYGRVQSVVRVREGIDMVDHAIHQQVHRLKFEYVDWDGEMHGYLVSWMDIPPFAGHKKIKVSELGAIPLDFCPSEGELRDKLIARGRQWSSLTGAEYKAVWRQEGPNQYSSSHRGE